MEVGCCEGERVPAMNAAKVINSSSDVEMDYLDADCVEEETTWTDVQPDVLEVELGDDFDPDLSREFGNFGVSAAKREGEMGSFLVDHHDGGWIVEERLLKTRSSIDITCI